MSDTKTIPSSPAGGDGETLIYQVPGPSERGQLGQACFDPAVVGRPSSTAELGVGLDLAPATATRRS